MDKKLNTLKPNLSTIGGRLKYLREFAHLDRNEAGHLARVAHDTYKDWENNKTNLTTTRAYWLIDALQAYGIDCSIEWLLTGELDPPQKDSTFFIKNPIKINLKDEKKQKQIQEEYSLFCRHNPCATHLVVADNAMLPTYEPEDIVAGIQYPPKKIENLIGQNCIVTLKNNEVMLRNLQASSTENCYTLLATNTQSSSALIVHNAELISAAPVIWLRKLGQV
ncbi:MAG: hypothetical protein KAT71_04000 [Gammaproteobacteria bacterium]|nr:hypothetical protein [Gammaproteobacteria bacterium]